MKKRIYNLIFVLLGLLSLTFISCSEDPEPSLYELVKGTGVAPTITSITSSTPTALAGVSVLTINGSNFSNKVEENTVFFNGVKGTVLSASANKLEVKSPATVFGDSVKIKITVFKNENISNTFIFSISNPINIPYPFDPKVGDIPWAVTVRNNGDLIVSLDGKGIKRISGNTMSDFIPKGAESYWNTIKITPSGDVYGSRNLRGIWKLQQNTPPSTAPWSITPTGTRVWDFDWDNNQNIWAVGNNNVIIKVKPDLSTSTYEFVANLRTVRFYNGYLYVAGVKDNREKVWRFTINASGDLGTAEDYVDLTNRYPSVIINTMTFGSDGVLYLGTNKKTDPILEVKPDKSISDFYPGIIPASDVISFYWQGQFLYFIRKADTRDQTVIRVNMLKNGAPYFGN
ncbi:MAG: IPT/TIG domain-containing protein [Ignavibacterium sp.]|nr:IPT/TIG domain-containing protein [Ignavibacterium sp.]